MNASRIIRRLPSLLLLLLPLGLGALGAGCSNDDQLTVRGEAAVSRGAEAVERFSFPDDVALQSDDLAAATEGVFGGDCTLDPGGFTEVDAPLHSSTGLIA